MLGYIFDKYFFFLNFGISNALRHVLLYYCDCAVRLRANSDFLNLAAEYTMDLLTPAVRTPFKDCATLDCDTMLRVAE